MRTLNKLYKFDFLKEDTGTDDFYVHYCLINTKNNNVLYRNNKIYGIQLIKEYHNSDTIVTSDIIDISQNKDLVIDILEVLYKNAVTPVVLKEVLGEMICC